MKKIITSIFILFAIVQLHAQQATMSASVNKSKIAYGERFQLTITVSNAGSVKDYRPPTMSDFIVVGGPNQSTNPSYLNGKVSSNVIFSYMLQPRNVGKFTIGAAYIKSGDKTLSSQPLIIEVTERTSNTQNNTEDKTINPNDPNADLQAYIKENVIIKTEVSDLDIYKGEDISVVLKFCVKVNSLIYGYRILQAVQVPKYDGFYALDIDLNNQQSQIETINGVQYKVSTFKKTVLTPQIAGTLELDPITIDALFGVQVKKQKSGDALQDYLNDFFSNSGNKEVRASITSGTVKVNVRELPLNQPADFNGAVGKFSMKTEINSTTTKTDEPLTYRIIITGSGNLELFKAPALILPPGWETYDPQTSTAGNTKTYEYLLIPRSPGEFTIPAYTWTFLDPIKNRYETLSSKSYKVQVEVGAGYKPSVGNYALKEEVEMLAQDIRYIKKTGNKYENTNNDFFGSGIFYSLVGLPFIAGLGIFFFTMQRKKLLGDHAALKYSKANLTAKKRLLQAKNLSESKDQKEFYNEILKTIWGYLGDKLSITQSELSKENIREVLIKRNVSIATAENMLELLNSCEMSLFAPKQSASSTELLYKNATDLITALESEIQ